MQLPGIVHSVMWSLVSPWAPSTSVCSTHSAAAPKGLLMCTPAQRLIHMWKEIAKATMFPTLHHPQTLVPQTSALRDTVLKRGLQKRTNIDPHLSLEPDVWSAPLTEKKTATNNTLIYYSGNMLLSFKSDDMKLNQLPVLLWIILTVPVAQRASYRENKCILERLPDAPLKISVLHSFWIGLILWHGYTASILLI